MQTIYTGNVLYTRNVGQLLQGLFGEDYLEKDAGFKNAIEMQHFNNPRE